MTLLNAVSYFLLQLPISFPSSWLPFDDLPFCFKEKIEALWGELPHVLSPHETTCLHLNSFTWFFLSFLWMGFLCSFLRPVLLEIPSLSTYMVSFLLLFCFPSPPYHPLPPPFSTWTSQQTTNIWAKLSVDPTLPTSSQFELSALAMCTFYPSFFKHPTVMFYVTKEHPLKMLLMGLSLGPGVSSQASLPRLVNAISHSWWPLSPWTTALPRLLGCVVYGPQQHLLPSTDLFHFC